MTKEELISLQSDLQASRDENAKLLHLYQESNNETSRLKNKIKDFQEQHQKELLIDP
jgi:hypothetical protein